MWRELLPPEAINAADELAERAESLLCAGVEVYPPRERVFAALEETPPERVRAVIAGQDPYHGPGQANGLAFSVNAGVTLPPSLRNIFKELRADTGSAPESGDLTPWARQGVLLLNSSLTVTAGQAGSHSKWGWQRLTGAVLRACAELPQPVVFLLWGRDAHALVPQALPEGKLGLRSSHPSPLGASRPCGAAPPFLGSRPFSRTNEFLIKHGSEPINW